MDSESERPRGTSRKACLREGDNGLGREEGSGERMSKIVVKPTLSQAVEDESYQRSPETLFDMKNVRDGEVTVRFRSGSFKIPPCDLSSSTAQQRCTAKSQSGSRLLHHPIISPPRASPSFNTLKASPEPDIDKLPSLRAPSLFPRWKKKTSLSQQSESVQETVRANAIREWFRLRRKHTTLASVLQGKCFSTRRPIA